MSCMLLASIETIHAQLTTEDYAVIKHYPAVERQMVKPKNFSYTSKQGVTLNYLQSSGRSYEVKYDDGEMYTDGVADAWVKGVLKIGKQSYSLYGSYVAEGYLSGVLYDSNKEMFGLLEWQIEDTMTATLKTKKATYNYFFTKSSKPVSSIPKPPVAESLKPKNDALTELLKDGNYNWKDNDTLQVKVQEGNGVGSGHGVPKVEKDVLYLSDLVEIENLSDDEKIKQIKKWGWEARLITGKSKDDNYIFATKSEYGLKVAIRTKSLDGNTVGSYSFSNCSLGYVNQFVEKAKKKGYHLIEDKKAFLKLKSDDSVITVNKSMLEYNQQYFTIEVK